MGIDGHVSGGSRERFPLAVRDMLFCLGVAILLSHTKVDDMDDIGGLSARSADEEVIRLDVSIDEVLFVYCLDA